MKDRTREAVFNLIGPSVRDTHVWDLFAGTGAMALEALSRGAESATMIEQHRGTAKIISDNVHHLKVDDRASVVSADLFAWSQAFADPSTRLPPAATGRSTLELPWLVFCCPPYALYRERLDDLQAALLRIRAVAPADSQFVVEAERPFAFEQLWDGPWRTRDYAPAAVGIS